MKRCFQKYMSGDVEYLRYWPSFREKYFSSSPTEAVTRVNGC